jgi:hypothetical protein
MVTRSYASNTWAPALLITIVGLTATAAQAQQRWWSTNGTGDFSDTANWSASSGGATGASAPDLTQDTHFALSGAGPYTVNFTGNGASNTVDVTNNVVTIDANAFTYTVGDASTGSHDITVSSSGAGQSAQFKVVDGTISQGSLPPFSAGVQVLNFVRVQGGAGSDGAKFTVDGSSAVVWAGQTRLNFPGGGTSANNRLEVLNGGTYHSISDMTDGGFASSVAVSGANSLLASYSLNHGGTGESLINVSSGGTLRVRSSIPGFNAGNFVLGHAGVLTLDNGTVELNGVNGGTLFNHNEIRGTGTIKRAAGASGFSTVRQDSDETGNYSRIRPGDISATPAVGTINIEDANLTASTNGPAGAQQTIFLDIASQSSFDKISLTDPGADDGTATATLAGQILFNNLSPINFTSDTTMDFITAEAVTDAGFTTNIATAAAGWTFNGGTNFTYDLSIVTVGANVQRLRLSVNFVPEPTCGALVALAAPLMMRRRGRSA